MGNDMQISTSTLLLNMTKESQLKEEGFNYYKGHSGKTHICKELEK